MSASAPTGNAHRPVQQLAAEASKSEPTGTKKTGFFRKFTLSKGNQKPQVSQTADSNARGPSNGGLARQGSVGSPAAQPALRGVADGGDMRNSSVAPASSASGAGQVGLSDEARQTVLHLHQITNVDQRKGFFSFKAKTKPPQKFNDNEKKKLDVLLNELSFVKEQLTTDEQNHLSTIDANKDYTGPMGKKLWKDGVRELLKSLASSLSSPVAPSASQGAPQPERAGQENLRDYESDGSDAENPDAHNHLDAPPAGDQQDEQPALPPKPSNHAPYPLQPDRAPKPQPVGLSTVLEGDDEDGEEIRDNISESSSDYAKTGIDQDETGIDQEELDPAPENAQEGAQAPEGGEKLKAFSFKLAPPKPAETQKRSEDGIADQSEGASSGETEKGADKSKTQKILRNIKFNSGPVENDPAAEPASPKEIAKGAEEAKGGEAGGVNPEQPEGGAEPEEIGPSQVLQQGQSGGGEAFVEDPGKEKLIKDYGPEEAVKFTPLREYMEKKAEHERSQGAAQAEELAAPNEANALPEAGEEEVDSDPVLGLLPSAQQLRERQAAAAAAQQAARPEQLVNDKFKQELAAAVAARQAEKEADAEGEVNNDVAPTGQEGAPLSLGVTVQDDSDDEDQAAQGVSLPGVQLTVAPASGDPDGPSGSDDSSSSDESTVGEDGADAPVESFGPYDQRHKDAARVIQRAYVARNPNSLSAVVKAVVDAKSESTTRVLKETNPHVVLKNKKQDLMQRSMDGLQRTFNEFHAMGREAQEWDGDILKKDLPEVKEKIAQIDTLANELRSARDKNRQLIINTGAAQRSGFVKERLPDANPELQQMLFTATNNMKRMQWNVAGLNDKLKFLAGLRDQGTGIINEFHRDSVEFQLGQLNGTKEAPFGKIQRFSQLTEALAPKNFANSADSDRANEAIAQAEKDFTADISKLEETLDGLEDGELKVGLQQQIDNTKQSIVQEISNAKQVVVARREAFDRVFGARIEAATEQKSRFDELRANLENQLDDTSFRKEHMGSSNDRGETWSEWGLSWLGMGSRSKSDRFDSSSETKLNFMSGISTSLLVPNWVGREAGQRNLDSLGLRDRIARPAQEWDEYFGQGDRHFEGLDAILAEEAGLRREVTESIERTFVAELEDLGLELDPSQETQLKKAAGVTDKGIDRLKTAIAEDRAKFNEIKTMYFGSNN